MSLGLLSKPKLGGLEVSLWPFQNDAVNAVRQQFVDGKKSTLMVLPTGCGKTITFGMITRKCIEKGGRVLVLAHRGELINQAAAKLCTLGVDASIEQAGSYARSIWEPDCVVGTVQTLRGKRLESWPQDYFRLVITDEAHHATADTYQAIYRHFKALHLGVTATADRADEDTLSDVFESVAFEYSMWDAMKAPHPGPYLCRLTFVQCDLQIDLRSVRTTAGDFNQGDLEARITPMVDSIANAIRQEVGDRKTIVFTPDVGSGQAIASAMRSLKDANDESFKAESVWGNDPERDRKIEWFHDGRIKILCNCALLTEGFDCPDVSAIVLCRPTKSRPLYAQMVGRGTRIASGKDNCIAEGQKVLTDHGLVNIEEVEANMKVWDGCEFVSHLGVAFRGEQPVISYAGLTATPDHKVWTETGWRAFDECQKNKRRIAVTESGGRPIRESDNRFRRNNKGRARTKTGVGRMLVLQKAIIQRSHQRSFYKGGMPGLRTTTKISAMALREMPVSTTKMHQSKGSGVSSIWSNRNTISFCRSRSNGAMGSRQPRLASQYVLGPERQRRSLRAGKSEISQQQAELLQHATKAKHGEHASLAIRASRDSLRGQHATQDVQRRNDGCGNHQKISREIVQTKRRVWDILNAGPRHRFTVEGLLVSNCLIVDFDYLTVKHDLVRPVELFDTTHSDTEVLDIAMKLIKDDKELPLDEAIEKADRLKEERAQVRVKARQRDMRYKKVSYDPLAVCDALGMPWRGSGDLSINKATAAQVALLTKFGVEEAGSISKTRAKTLIDFLISRRKAGLATHKQTQWLIAKGVEPGEARAITFEDASKRLDQLFSRGRATVLEA